MTEPTRIYLQPDMGLGDEGRTWCADRVAPEDVAYVRADLVERKNAKLQTEIDRLRDIISGALAHSYGPYSDTELLRRVVVILKSIRAEIKRLEAENKTLSEHKGLPTKGALYVHATRKTRSSSCSELR